MKLKIGLLGLFLTQFFTSQPVLGNPDPDYVECNDSHRDLRVVFSKNELSGQASLVYTRNAITPQQNRAVAAKGDEIQLSETPIGTLVTAEDKSISLPNSDKELVSFLLPRVEMGGAKTEAFFSTSVFESTFEMGKKTEVIQNNFSFPVECRAIVTK